MPTPKALFQLGSIVASPAAIELLEKGGIDPVKLIDRHVSGDFGEVGEMGPGSLNDDGSNEHSDGLALNSLAILGGDEHILSVYRVGEEDRVYVETPTRRFIYLRSIDPCPTSFAISSVGIVLKPVMPRISCPGSASIESLWVSNLEP